MLADCIRTYKRNRLLSNDRKIEDKNKLQPLKYIYKVKVKNYAWLRPHHRVALQRYEPVIEAIIHYAYS